ncbi:CatB-related O-acetyltransferase [Xanthobacter dioxanivorans]|uniref:CatB-related O-acetyltransferase n=1 Tax=Xanthobacter dioxanivorans TaxID=2528964 RepID=A0A974PKP9_9HYPH|nr:CatB-related O-acetyltransferase [Xanthobacter dioxanivorans]QRG05279.1 CatB-related O-acetyltransferase [Xanthobacter dioxanivorans]
MPLASLVSIVPPPPAAGARNFRLEPPARITKQIRWDTAVEVGAFTMLHGPGEIVCASIGRYCSIAPGVVIGANEHAMEWLTTSSLAENPNLFGWHRALAGEEGPARNFAGSLRPIKIGNDVWIGQNAFIRGGVTIGDGAVIGGMSNVIQSVPPYAIVAGNPARIIRYRFDGPTIARLCASSWWRYSLVDLQRFDLSDPLRALDEIDKAIEECRLREYNPGWLTVADLL